MIRVGLTRWLVHFSTTQDRRGDTTIAVSAIPQAKTYKKPDGSIHTPGIQYYKHVAWTKDLKPKLMVEIARHAAYEVSTGIADEVSRLGLMGPEYDRKCTLQIASGAILKAIERNENDQLDLIEEFDVTETLTALENDRRAREIERELQQRLQYQAHQEDVERREAVREQAKEVSLDFLKTVLNSTEWEEYNTHKRVTIKLPQGKFVISGNTHDMVRQYDDNGIPVAKWCIVFGDAYIPFGDEIGMKVLLLKANPKKFFETANRFGP